MLLRNMFAMLLAMGVLAGCQTTTAPSQPAKDAANTSAPVTSTNTGSVASVSEATVAQAHVVDVEVVVNHKAIGVISFGDLNEAIFVERLDSKATRILGAANPGGAVKAKAVITVNSVIIASKNVRAKAYDSVIGAHAQLFDTATGLKIGGKFQLGLQATYRPALAGGRDRVLSPEQELELITTHSVTKLKENMY